VPGVRRDRRRAEKRFGAGCGKAGREDRPECEAEYGRDQTERGGLQREGHSDLTRCEADRLQQPNLAVLLARTRADKDSDDDERHDQEQNREHRDDHLRALGIAQCPVALLLPGEVESGLRIGGRKARCCPPAERRGGGRIHHPHRL
jgi:hypothetical protein